MTSSYDNRSNKTTYLEISGSDVINQQYEIDFSSLIDSSTELSNTVSDSEEIIVIRKFPAASISPDITATEAFSAWTLPDTSSTRSSMYTISGSTILMSSTASDYTWTSAMSGRSADVALPVISASDTIYVVRKTYALTKFVTWAPGSRITSGNLNIATDQLLNLSQEIYNELQNFSTLNPSVGTINGVCPLNSLGTIDGAFIDGNSLAIQTELGLQGAGTSADKLRTKLNGDSLVADTDGLKADTVNDLTSTSTTKPLSAAQGKALNDSLTSIGAGIVYKGGVNVASANTLGTASAGWTVTHTGANTTSRGSGWSIDTTGDGSNDSGTVSKGDILRYDGAQWDVVSTTAFVTADGDTELTGDWDAGSTRTISAKTQSTSDDSTKLSTTAYVNAKIAATTLDDLAEVDTDHAVANGDIIKRVGGEFVFVAPDDGTNGIALGDLKDVDVSGLADEYYLRYETSAPAGWKVIAQPSALTASLLTVGGTGDGSTNDYAALNTVFNTNSSVGTLDEEATASSTLRLVDGGGRKYETDQGVVMSNRSRKTFSNFEMILDSTGQRTLLKNNPSTIQVATKGGYTARTGDVVVELDSSDNDVFKPRQHVVFSQYNQVLGSDGLTRSAVNAGGEMILSNAATNTNEFYNYAGTAGYEVIKHWDDGSSRKFIQLDRPLDVDLTAGTLVEAYGGADSANGVDELRDIVFENVTFKNKRSDTFYPVYNGHTSATGAGGGNSQPFATSNSNAVVTFNAPNGHSLVAGSGSAATDRDYIRVEDEDFTSDFVSGSAASQWDVAKQINTSGITNNAVSITSTHNGAASSSGVGSGKAVIILDDKKTGIELTGANHIKFKKCRFEGWTEGAVVLEACNDIVFDECEFVDCRGNYKSTTLARGAITLKTRNSNIKVMNCTFLNCGVGIDGMTNRRQDDKRNDPLCVNLTVEKCEFVCKTCISTKMLLAGKTLIANNTFKYQHDIRSIFRGDYITKAVDLTGGVEELILEGNDACHYGYVDTETYDKTKYWATGTGWTPKSSLATAWADNKTDMHFDNTTTAYLPQWNYGFDIAYARNQFKISSLGFGMIGDVPDDGGASGGQFKRGTQALGAALIHLDDAPDHIQIRNNKVASFGDHGINVRCHINKEFYDTRMAGSTGRYFNLGGILIDSNSVSAGKRGISVGAAWDSDSFRVAIKNVVISRNSIKVDPQVCEFGLYDTTTRRKSFWPGWNDSSFAKGMLLSSANSNDVGRGSSGFIRTKGEMFTGIQLVNRIINGQTRVTDVDIKHNIVVGPLWNGYPVGCAMGANTELDPTQVTNRDLERVRVNYEFNTCRNWMLNTNRIIPDDGPYGSQSTSSPKRLEHMQAGSAPMDPDRSYTELGCAMHNLIGSGIARRRDGSHFYSGSGAYRNTDWRQAWYNANDTWHTDGMFNNGQNYDADVPSSAELP